MYETGNTGLSTISEGRAIQYEPRRALRTHGAIVCSRDILSLFSVYSVFSVAREFLPSRFFLTGE